MKMKKWTGKLAAPKADIADRGSVKLGSCCISAIFPAWKS